ncbi:MAG: hypothetical protein ACK5HR_02520 [Mycoplasmatales bacterium]
MINYADEVEEGIEQIVKHEDEVEEAVEDVIKYGDEAIEGVGKISSNEIVFSDKSLDKSFTKHSSDFGEYLDGSNDSRGLYDKI